MGGRHRIYLIPGFFGFADLGDLQYFGHVERFLRSRLEELGVQGAVHVVPTRPTASLRQRAHDLLDAVTTTAGPDDELHLVGHSSGGLDARLFATPGAVLPDDETAEPFASQVRSVIGVATPHLGTPAAEFFTSLYGKKVLALLSVATVFIVRHGHLPVGIGFKLARLVHPLIEGRQREPTVAEELFETLLGEFSEERRASVRRFFAEVATDQGLLSQITPDGMDVFNAATPDRPGVRYGSVLTRARPPGVVSTLKKGLRPYAQAMNAVYASCWTLASRIPATYLPEPGLPWRELLEHAYPEPVEPSSNDGMVPTLAQLHGTPIRAVEGDHLDVIGHYADPEADPPHYDWLTTGSGFRRPHFEATWTDVAHFLLALEPFAPEA